MRCSPLCLVQLAPVLAAALIFPAQAQAPAHSFEVATIRPIDSKTPPKDCIQPWVFPTNRFTMHCASIPALIQLAYGVERIAGLPEWANSRVYSVSAKVEGDALLTQKQMQPLLQDMLEQRFHLKIHRVQTIVPGYALVAAPGGPHLQHSKGGAYVGSNGACELKYQNTSVEAFGKAIGRTQFKKPVADKTGLDGMYDFDLKFTPEDGPVASDPGCSNYPDILTALQRQFGLKLLPQKIPVDTLVIDHVDKTPTEN